MMTLTKEQRQHRNAMLKELRERHKESVERTQALLKEQNTVRRALCQALRDGPRTVPELAEATDMLPHEVLWHITAMKKYDQVVETGRCGEYYLYALSEERGS